MEINNSTFMINKDSNYTTIDKSNKVLFNYFKEIVVKPNNKSGTTSVSQKDKTIDVKYLEPYGIQDLIYRIFVVSEGNDDQFYKF